MTKSCVVSRVQFCVNLHEFLKTKRRILKIAKKSAPTNNWNDTIKHNYEKFGEDFTIEEFHGSIWSGVHLFRKTESTLIFLAKKNRAPINNSTSNLPEEFLVKSSLTESSSSLHHEKEVLSNLGPFMNLVDCYGDEITISKSGEKVYNVFFEYCSGSSLRDHIRKFGPNGLQEHEVRKYTRDIVHGLYYMHCNGRYIHGDIKSRNILLSHGMAKLASFGLARKLTAEVICEEEISGSGPYASPELAREGYLGWPADIWALGCVVLEMFTGKSAWSFGDAHRYLMDCNNEKIPEIPKNISREGRDFIKKCLIRSPYKRRPSWLLIKHPFVCQ
ncbi:mitogen-activated protein kinase kinase kinase YODA-like [Cucumis melo var. makuwa]|uniref:Mitogen-activated protein kinase kinase kinase YODA-like n=2 Tax=Cucumis melo TaxID=3656 RepID=A0A5D3D3K9_CUCMM|nr:mitogen-activated protein kinase kinase kinase YODA-like [Cucumis melo var. makuwa]TYK17746.1 mitogen-activated protein kinase kinase kinase YODA-like [Cucumis melo var. makuwa]